MALANTRMPFGRYKGYVLIDVPEDYLLWLANKGWPDGSLGQLLYLALEIKTYDQQFLLDPLRNNGPGLIS